MSLSGIAVANLVLAKRRKVKTELAWLFDKDDAELIIAELLERKVYVRYLDALNDYTGTGIKCAIIAIYEAIGEPDQALTELKKYMYS